MVSDSDGSMVSNLDWMKAFALAGAKVAMSVVGMVVLLVAHLVDEMAVLLEVDLAKTKRSSDVSVYNAKTETNVILNSCTCRVGCEVG